MGRCQAVDGGIPIFAVKIRGKWARKSMINDIVLLSWGEGVKMTWGSWEWNRRSRMAPTQKPEILATRRFFLGTLEHSKIKKYLILYTILYYNLPSSNGGAKWCRKAFFQLLVQSPAKWWNSGTFRIKCFGSLCCSLPRRVAPCATNCHMLNGQKPENVIT